MVYNIHGGHNPSGKIACGASDLLDESREDRKICKEVVRLLKKKGHKAYNCTVSNGTSQTDVLRKICTKCNKRQAALDVSIHLNSGRNDHKGDKKIAGTEIWCTQSVGIKKTVGNRILANMKKLGFTNRGIKTTGNLYYLNHTINKAILIEVCFVDDRDDYNLYKNLDTRRLQKRSQTESRDNDLTREKSLVFFYYRKVRLWLLSKKKNSPHKSGQRANR